MGKSGGSRLTLTWDVLKLRIFFITIRGKRINFNMGCIETIHLLSCVHCGSD